MISERLRRQMCTHIRFEYYRGVSVWPGSDRRGSTLLIHWMTLMQESPSAEGFHSEITVKSLLLTWTEFRSFQTFPTSNRTEPSPPPWHHESQSVLWLRVCWHYSFGSMKSSSGSDTRSPQWAFHGVQTPPPQFSELVGLGERNTRSFRGIPH